MSFKRYLVVEVATSGDHEEPYANLYRTDDADKAEELAEALSEIERQYCKSGGGYPGHAFVVDVGAAEEKGFLDFEKSLSEARETLVELSE